jgi:ribosomal protein S18 acetylase RimI-like enzyme
VIRPATLEDAAGIARVHVRAWRRAYPDILDPQILDDLSVEEFAQRWTGLLGDPGSRAWVCEVDGAVRGFASVRDSEMTTLYVDPAAQGAGVGTALLREATDAGARTLQVLEANGEGRRFYERRGWAPTGPGEDWRGLATVRYEPSPP